MDEDGREEEDCEVMEGTKEGEESADVDEAGRVDDGCKTSEG